MVDGGLNQQAHPESGPKKKLVMLLVTLQLSCRVLIKSYGDFIFQWFIFFSMKDLLNVILLVLLIALHPVISCKLNDSIPLALFYLIVNNVYHGLPTGSPST